MTRVMFADEDGSGRDPLTGSPLGDPRVAVRAGIALTFALVIARVGNLAIFTTIRGQHLKEWLTEWQIAFAVALPLGAALTVMAWRDRPGRPLVLRAAEAALLAYLAWAVTESWAFLHLQRVLAKNTGTWWFSLTQDFHARLPEIGGNALGLFFAARQRGRHAVGVAFEIPSALGSSLGLVLYWPQMFSAGVVFVGSAIVMLVAPLSERVAHRVARVVRPPP